MLLSWWQSAIVSSIIFIVIFIPFYNMLANSLFPYHEAMPYDFGQIGTTFIRLLILFIFVVGVNILNFFLVKNRKRDSFIVLWFILIMVFLVFVIYNTQLCKYC